MASLTLPPRPPSSPPLHHAWQTLADGLLAQRLHLHLDEWRSIVSEGKALPDVHGADVSALAQRPFPLLDADNSAVALLEEASLRFWWELPWRHGLDPRGRPGAVRHAADAAAQSVLAGPPDGAWAHAVTAVSGAAAWWVGFFAVIRHRGVHHLTLEPHPSPLYEQALGSAVSMVAWALGLL